MPRNRWQPSKNHSTPAPQSQEKELQRRAGRSQQPTVTKETGIRVIGAFRRSKPTIQNAEAACPARRRPLVAALWRGKRVRKSSASMASMGLVRVSVGRLMALWKRNLEAELAACMARRSTNSPKSSSDKTATRRTSGSPKWAIRRAPLPAAREHLKLKIKDNFSEEWDRRQLKAPPTHSDRITKA